MPLLYPIAAALAGATAGAAAIVFARDRILARAQLARASAALATGLGVVCGWLLAVGPQQFRLRDVALCVVPMIYPLGSPWWTRPAARRAARVVVAAVLAATTTWPLVINSWGAASGTLRIALAALVVVLIWELIDAAASRGKTAVALTLASLIAGSAVMVLGGSARYAQHAAMVAASFFVSMPALMVDRRYSAAGATDVAWPVTAMIWLQGLYYAETPPIALAALLLSASAPAILGIERIGRRGRAVLAMLAAVFAIAAALAIAYNSYDTSGYG